MSSRCFFDLSVGGPGVFAMQRCEPEKFARPFSTLPPLCYR
jgi:hypothetical protein